MGVTREFVTHDLTLTGALSAGGGLGAADVRYTPEPSGLVPLARGRTIAAARRRRHRATA